MVKYSTSKKPHANIIAKGAFINALGTVGKGLMPVFIIMITRLYGPAIVGLYIIAETVVRIAVTLSVSGINDGMMMFLSREIDNKEKENKMYKILANAVIYSFVIALIIILVAFLGGIDLIMLKYPKPEVGRALNILIWSIPFTFIPIIVISTTKALMIMKWDAILLGFVTPLSLILFSLVFYFISPTLESLLWGYLFTQILVTIISLIVFHHYYSYRKLFYHLRHFRFFKPLLMFSIPQNLNLAFNRFVTNLDIMMLGYFDFSSEIIAFYYAGAQIVKNLRQVKLAFSGSFAPIIARLHAKEDYFNMNKSFSMVSRWTSMIIFPLSLLVVIFRNELILLFHHSYTYSTMFMIVLLVRPLISCTFGLAANLLVMTGHSGWNLMNSLVSAFLNILMNYILIKHFGFIGAALATAGVAIFIITIIMFEVRFLINAKIILKRVYKPYVAIAFPVILTLLVLNLFSGLTLFHKIPLFLSMLGLYLFTLYILGIEEEDKAILRKKTGN